MKTMIKKNFLYKTVILSGLLLVFSCAQDAIFYKISTETAPKKPRIPGAPTNMVLFERNGVPVMYVASGRLHWYAKSEGGDGASKWDSAEYKIPQPGGRIISLAVTQDYLYALSISSSGATTTLRRIGHSEEKWNQISSTESKYTKLQTIYADGTDWLFAGAMNNRGSDYGILFLDDTSADPPLQLLISNTEILSGAASRTDSGTDNYYLSTIGKGVYKVPKTALSTYHGPVSIDEADSYRLIDIDNPETPSRRNRLFMGMIKLANPNNSIIVIQRDGGAFFDVQEYGFKRIIRSSGSTVSTGKYATGSLALWQQVNFDEEGTPSPGDYKMLVAGIQGGLYSTTTSSSYTHGYAEFLLKPDGSLDIESTRSISPDITVNGFKDRYSATIGKHPINSMYQVPRTIDDKMIFFASTQTAGLWSYRYRKPDGWQWNAEGTNEP